MKIVHKLTLSSIVAILLTLAVIGALLVVSEKTKTAMQALESAGSINNAVGELNIITYEYLLYHEDRMKAQWFVKRAAIRSSLQEVSASAQQTDNAEFIHAIQSSLENFGTLFAKVIDHHGHQPSHTHNAPNTSQPQAADSLEARLIGRMLISCQEMITNAARFNALTLAQMKTAERQQVRIAIMVMIMFAVALTAILFLLRKSITRPLRRLLEGTRIIGGGNLCHTVEIISTDEIGSLAASFNEMTRSLKETTASRDELDSEITERKKAEEAALKSQEEWEKTFDAMNDIITIQDRDMRIVRANKAAGDFFRVAPADLTGKKCHEIFEAADSPCANCPERLTLEDKQSHSADITHAKIGRIFHVTSSPILDHQGEVSHIVHIARDITAQKQAAKKQASLEERLRQAEKMEAIGTLAGGIAHDFNNILSVIIGYTEMVKDDMPRDSKFVSDLEKVLEAGNRAKELVKQILAFSRQSKIDRLPIQLQSLIKEALKMLRSSIPTTIEIREDLDSRCGVVLADPTQVHQILMNLCTNANHAMEATGGILHIQLKKTSIPAAEKILPGEYVELVVADTGSGIGPDLIDKIFDPYFTTKEQGKGTGMGLAIIHGIITGYGGTITVESEVGKGTTFHVYFPVVAKEELPMVKKAEKIPVGTERVLFVDDEEFLAAMGKDILGRLGYSVTVRHNSLDALATFQNTPEAFDVIITDQTMPGMTGADLARRMLQIRPDIPIILCTGFSNIIDEDSAKALGIREFALKPLTKIGIATLIRKVLPNP